MQIPTTAGEFLTEDRLRAYAKCSQFYFYGGEVSHDIPIRVLKETIEKILAQSTRRDQDPASIMAPVISQIVARVTKQEQLTESQQEALVKQTVLLVDEFFRLFPGDKYTVVSPALPLRVLVSKTPVNLQVSGVLRSAKNQTLHIIDFSPYQTEHALNTDPVAILKVHLLKDVVREEYMSRRPQAMIHMFGLTKQGNLTYSTVDSNETNQGRVARVEGLVKQIEQGFQYPLTPCPHACPFKSKCRPGG